MTQKDKVKELVGRGLDSYHTKSLQQIDRIEKKNKEQNHKISILSNELDNDYLTKTEEGSVISLEHSKEGMVYLDELQGNTLVNYCTDGSKELTLNGDIDLEGINVTTDQGVDNGKVDVMCEGNTLVNLSNFKGVFDGREIISSTAEFIIDNTPLVQELVIGKTYTLIDYSELSNTSAVDTYRIEYSDSLNNKRPLVSCWNKKLAVFTVPDDYVSFKHIYVHTNGDRVNLKLKAMILEGDWTEKEIPPYFEGMKSVGQDDENGHKIEILSQSSYPNLIKKSKNLSGNRSGSDTSNQNGVQYLIEDNVEFARVSANKQDFSNLYWWLQTVEPRKKGETYTISYDYRCTSDWNGYWYPSESYSGSFFPSTNGEWRRMKITRTVTGGDAKGDMLFGVSIRGTEIGDYIDIKNVKMEKGTNNSKWIPSVMDEEFLLAKYSNKKEILLNEPLRELPNGIKDRFVKISNKWFVERNCGVFNINDILSNAIDCIDKVNGKSRLIIKVETLPNLKPYTSADSLATNIYSDKYCIYATVPYLTNGDNIGIGLSSSTLSIKDIGTTIEEVKNSIREKNAKLLYQLTTPIYEPLEIEPTLLTYNDVTHISNNSIIPCNMKIQNSGYNAIIKPSTLYTVALDTNNNGTIGMNLGGAKGTTTNNVLTLTTPATLADDSLRLYGKGIKGSKVRLLEGDKTNYIPSFFEGMKSSFEDKLQDDGTYKMEILSKNKNIFDIDKFINESKSERYLNGFNCNFNEEKLLHSQFKRNTRYIIRCDFDIYDDGLHVGWSPILGIQFEDGLRQEGYLHHKNYIIATTGNRTIKYMYVRNPWNAYTYIYNISIHENIQNFEYIEPKSNKIQFSSIEPLRKWDRFVFKNGQLMIERGSKVFVLDGNTNGIDYTRGFDGAKDTDTNMLFSMKASKEVLPIAGKDSGCSSGICNILPNIYTVDVSTKDVPIGFSLRPYHSQNNYYINIRMNKNRMISNDINGIKDWLNKNNLIVEFPIIEPTYEEIPFELQKIILEGYENGTLFFDTNIPPTSTVTYAGETPIVKSVKLNKTEVLNNTNDINDNIVPYLMDMDYRVVCLQLQSENINDGVSMAKLFGGTYEMLQRDIQSKRYSVDEYKHRLDAYLDANKITEEEYNKLGDMLNE